MTATLVVEEADGLVTVQDRGRVGLAHLGVPRAGALDGPAAELANRLVGNDETAAVLEVTMGGLAVRATEPLWIAVTGARCTVFVDGRASAHGEAVWVPRDGTARIGPPETGVRTYLAVSGGIAVEPVLGSRATDTLAWVGPPRVVAGTELPVGRAGGAPAAYDAPRPPRPGPLRVDRGPRAAWFAADALERLCATPYTVTPASNRIGLRLDGPPLERVRDGELASEGMVLGAVQVPPDGTPVVFLADHPTTGGYPVLAVVRADDLWRCAQLRPGNEVRFTRG
ncbi:MAG TPA: biotin-dependent carboxyltransferase family protein [Nocardioides sp.]|nr:biotin-dependent carboxyltransferase family protein [Nocardioides sp.]